MASRITEKDLYLAEEMINRYLGGPVARLSGAYGGWKFIDGGTGTDLLGTGYVSRRELYEAAHVWARGFRAAADLHAREVARHG